MSGENLFDSFHPFSIWVENASHGLDLPPSSLNQPQMVHATLVSATLYFLMSLNQTLRHESILSPNPWRLVVAVVKNSGVVIFMSLGLLLKISQVQ